MSEAMYRFAATDLNEIDDLRAQLAARDAEIARLKRCGPCPHCSWGFLDGIGEACTECNRGKAATRLMAMEAELNRLRAQLAAAAAPVLNVLQVSSPFEKDVSGLRAQLAAAEKERDVKDGMVTEAIKKIEELRIERDKLAAFKKWTHDFLDTYGVPHHPPGTHGEHGCRIGDRMDWVMEQLGIVTADRDRLREANEELFVALRDAVSWLASHYYSEEVDWSLSDYKGDPLSRGRAALARHVSAHPQGSTNG